MKKGKIISLDAETNGLWGNPFAIGAILYIDGKEIDRVALRCPIDNEVNSWVEENVLPTLTDMEVSNTSMLEMLKKFGEWYIENKEDATVLYHMGHIVEANLVRLMVKNECIGEWDAPYTPIEVADHLRLAGLDPASVDGPAKANGIVVEGSTHNPLYDAEVAYRVWETL